MLRVQFKENDNRVTMMIEGRLVGRFAEDLRELVLRTTFPGALVVDLSYMSFVDDTGEQVLSWLSRIGAKFLTENAYSSDVCHRLALPLFSSRRRPTLNQHTRHGSNTQ